MANSRGTPQSIPGSYQTIDDSSVPNPPGFRLEFDNSEFAFRLQGTVVSVAEPNSASLLLVGALGLLVLWRSRAERVRRAA